MAKVLFRNVNVLDCTGAPPFTGQVLVEGNRIKAVAPQGASIASDGARLVDGGGATLMPGLVEAHSHLTFLDTADLESLGFVPPEEHTLRTAKNAKKLLEQGFTACNSAASAKARLDVVIRNAIDAGDIPGPRTRAASPELATTAGLGDVRLRHMHRETFAIICDGPEEFRKTAREMVREGVDTLKINPSGDEFVPHCRAHHTVMTEAEIEAVCEVGRMHGKRVAAHARSAESVRMCVRHGVDVVYHATYADAAARDALESVKDRVFVAPALSVTWTRLHEAGHYGLPSSDAIRARIERDLDATVECMRDLKSRGVRVLPGGDYGFLWNPHGRNARDLTYFTDLLGFTPMEAIVAATAWGGALMGGGLGTVQAGQLADLLLVDGDPLRDLAMLEDAGRLLAIMKDGAFHKAPPADLAARARAAA